MTSNATTRSDCPRAATALLAGLLCIALAACGGGAAALLVKLIVARFVPDRVTVVQGSTRTVELDVTCSLDGIRGAFRNSYISVSLTRADGPPPGVTATLVGGMPVAGTDLENFECAGADPDPSLRRAHIQVRLSASPGAAPATSALVAYVEIEPIIPGDPAPDATTATLDVTIAAAPAANYGTNLLVNPSFEEPVAAGGLPVSAGYWQGDAATTVGAEQATEPVDGAAMLRFIATGQQPGASTLTSQQWQVVDVSAFAPDIAAGRVSATARAWFHSIAGTTATDRRFDIRLLAFDGSSAELPQRYVANTPLLVRDAIAQTPGGQWMSVEAGGLLPASTTYVLVEIYAYEDVVNDAIAPEFDGHYADDVSFVLTRN